MRHFLYIIILFIFCSCQKEDPNYRDKYTGTYEFTTHSFEGFIYDDGDTTMVHEVYDTIIAMGNIEKLEEDKLKIVFWENYSEPDLEHESVPVQISGLIYPVVSDSGTLEYPEFHGMSSSYFVGSIINNDSLAFQYGVTRMFQKHEVQVFGKRIK